MATRPVPTPRNPQFDDPSRAHHTPTNHFYENLPHRQGSANQQGNQQPDTINVDSTLQSSGSRSELRNMVTVDNPQYQTLEDTSAAVPISGANPVGIEHAQNYNASRSVAMRQPFSPSTYTVGANGAQYPPGASGSEHAQYQRTERDQHPPGATEHAQYHQTRNEHDRYPQHPPAATEHAHYHQGRNETDRHPPAATGHAQYPSNGRHPSATVQHHPSNTEHPQFNTASRTEHFRNQHPPSGTEHAQYPPASSAHTSTGQHERTKRPLSPPAAMPRTEHAQKAYLNAEHDIRPWSPPGPAHMAAGTERAQNTPNTPHAKARPGADERKDNEIHLLRMNVTDKDEKIITLTRELDHCHSQMRQLNQVLSVKKEDVLKYQDQIANMKAELAELRDARMEGANNDAADQAYRMQMDQMSRQNSDLRRQLDQLRRQNEYEVQSLRAQLDQARMQSGAGFPRQDLDLSTKVEMLQLQVTTFKEDFDQERSDRERAQAELHVIKEENVNLKQALELLATEQGIQLGPAGLPLQRN